MKKFSYSAMFIVVTACTAPTADTQLNTIPTNAKEVTKIGESDFPSDGFQEDPAVLQKIVQGGIPNGRWNEGLMFEGVKPMPWQKSAANWFPNTEDVQPEEIRIIFMGSSPLIRPGQMNTSVFVQLGNGKNFIFDLGEGSIANYMAAGIALNEMNDVFITHLHLDHFAALPYLYVFGAWNGRLDEPLRVYGPSGRSPEYGVKHVMEGMKQMASWHTDAFDVFPIGRGFDLEVTEFDFADDGGVVYDKDGVKVIHWQQSHAKDGASAYRLDWNGLSVAFTGDGRPNKLTEKYAAGVDILITEMQTEVVEIVAAVQGVPPFLARYTIDTHHNPAYAAGYLYNKVKPRYALATHTENDEYYNQEAVAQVRYHWKGPFNFGFDGTVVNLTKDRVWVREGILPDFPNNTPPQAHGQIARNGGLVVPVPRNKREDIQNQFIRDMQYDPDLYYPKGYKPELLEDWPSDKPLFLPEEHIPKGMKKRMNQQE